MGSRQALFEKIERLIVRLKQPISSIETEDGWTEESRQVFIELLSRLAGRLRDKKPLEKKEREIYIARGMDHWGITGGDLLEEAAAISNALRQLK